MADGSALVLFSGGQDSTVCLAWALERYARVETIGFDYGQRHAVELAQRPRDPRRAGRTASRPGRDALGDDHVLELATLGAISDTALTRDTAFEMTAAGLPNTFVPGRNLLFFTYAAALGLSPRHRARSSAACARPTSPAIPTAATTPCRRSPRPSSLGMDAPFAIETPLMWIDKAGTWAMADELGGAPLVDLIVEHTHTCYHGRPHDTATPGATAAARAPPATCAQEDGSDGKPRNRKT